MRTPLVVLATFCAFLPAQDDKLDRGIANARGRREVFVRMTDQVLKKGSDYDAFCRKNKAAKRGELRAGIVASLKKKSAASWARTASV